MNLRPYLFTFVIVSYVWMIAQSPSPQLLMIDPVHSKATVHVGKEGLFAFAADNHEIDAPIVSGSFDISKDSVELRIDPAKMQVLDPQLPADRRSKVQANMLGPQVLDVQKYPEIRFHSTAISRAQAGQWTVTGDLSLHGQTHPVSVQVTKMDETHYRASSAVRQTEFGITPIRIAGGTVRVKDEVKIDFDVALKR